MTEAEWLTASDSKPLLTWLAKSPDWRKMRLVGCGCGRRILPFLNDDWLRWLLVASEIAADNECEQTRIDHLLADNQHSLDTCKSDSMKYQGIAGVVVAAGYHPSNNLFENGFYWMADSVARNRVPEPVTLPDDWDTPSDPAWRVAYADECAAQAAVMRDIFGNPFRPVVFSEDWRSSDAVAIARTMYDSRDFSAMPILADALQDAGCDNEDILSHCRDTNQPHVRGCWVVDLVLGKE